MLDDDQPLSHLGYCWMKLPVSSWYLIQAANFWKVGGVKISVIFLRSDLIKYIQIVQLEVVLSQSLQCLPTQASFDQNLILKKRGTFLWMCAFRGSSWHYDLSKIIIWYSPLFPWFSFEVTEGDVPWKCLLTGGWPGPVSAKLNQLRLSAVTTWLESQSSGIIVQSFGVADWTNS